MRKTLIACTLALAAAAGAVALVPPDARTQEVPAPAPDVVTVYKSPTCGCCSKWVDHLKASGFTVRTIDVADLSEIKAQAGVTRNLASCHTALVGKYTIEGHVPAADIRRLLKQQPEVAGLAVPGMPMGSPGMEGDRKDAYDVLAFDRTGRTEVWASH